MVINNRPNVRTACFTFKRWCPSPDIIFEELLDYPWRQEKLQMFDRIINEPRKVMWFAPKGYVYTYSGKQNEPLQMTQLLADLGEYASLAIEKELGETVKFNSVFCNYYENCTKYIGWHADDEPGLASNIIASISLGATRKFKKVWDYILENGDLAIMYGDCQ